MWNALIESWRNLRKEQRLSVVLLGVCGLTAIGLSVYRVGSAITDPFLVDRTQLTKATDIIGQTPEEKEALQKRTDTDGDGLSDWDEVNVYHTNPNLRDTCGDGIPDNVRVATGKNLHCQNQNADGGSPALFNAAATSSNEATGASALQQLYPSINTNSVIGPDAAESGSSTLANPTASDLQQMLPRDPAAIRAALQGKVDQAKLDALSDQQLLQYYDEAIAIQSGQSSGLTDPTATTTQ
jgi:hypothetical protein